MLQKKIWEKIKQLRQKSNLSQEEMAQILGVSRVTFSQIEQGERELKQSELSKLATTFEMSIDDFLNDKPQPSKAPLPKEKDKHYKFKQAFLYLLNKCAQKPNIWKTVLNKLLYFADFNHFEKYYESITGVDYVKMPRGPVPQIMDTVIAQMEAENQIRQLEVPYFQYTQQKIMPLVEPDLSMLNGQELAELDYVIDKYGDWNAEKLSEWSHWDMPWKATKKMGKVISYGLVGYRDELYAVSEREDDDD